MRLRGRECSDIRRSPMGAMVPPHLCICITAPHYFSFPNINICVQISPLPASELLMGLWAPLKCILATLLHRTHCSYLDASTCISRCVQSCNILQMLSTGVYIYELYIKCGALKCILRMRGPKICHWSPQHSLEHSINLK